MDSDDRDADKVQVVIPKAYAKGCKLGVHLNLEELNEFKKAVYLAIKTVSPNVKEWEPIKLVRFLTVSDEYMPAVSRVARRMGIVLVYHGKSDISDSIKIYGVRWRNP